MNEWIIEHNKFWIPSRLKFWLKNLEQLSKITFQHHVRFQNKIFFATSGGSLNNTLFNFVLRFIIVKWEAGCGITYWRTQRNKKILFEFMKNFISDVYCSSQNLLFTSFSFRFMNETFQSDDGCCRRTSSKTIRTTSKLSMPNKQTNFPFSFLLLCCPMRYFYDRHFISSSSINGHICLFIVIRDIVNCAILATSQMRKFREKKTRLSDVKLIAWKT